MQQYSLNFGKMCICLFFLSCGVTLEETINDTHCDNFELTCKEGEIILMTNAIYGRMDYGKCIEKNNETKEYEKNPRFFKCSKNILNYMHEKCSGKKTCNGSTGLIYLDHKNVCVIPGYVDFEYKCIRTNTNSCNINVSNMSRITSKLNMHHCKNLTIISAPGKAIKIVPMLVLDSGQSTISNGSLIGNITDLKNNFIGRLAANPIEIKSTAVNIVILDTVSNWMLNISEINLCPMTYLQNFTTVVEKTDFNVTLKCNLTGETWTLSCNDSGHWIGENRECTARTRDFDSEHGVGPYTGTIIASIVSITIVIIVATSCLVLCKTKRGGIRKLKGKRGARENPVEFEYEEREQGHDIIDNRLPSASYNHLEVPIEVKSQFIVPLAAHNPRAPYATSLSYAKKMPFQTTARQHGMFYPQNQYQNAVEVQPFTSNCTCFTMQYNHRGTPHVRADMVPNATDTFRPYHFGHPPMYPLYYTSKAPLSGTMPVVGMCCSEEVGSVYNTLEPFALPASFDQLMPLTDPIISDQPTDLTMARKKLTLSREDIVAAENTPWEEMK